MIRRCFFIGLLVSVFTLSIQQVNAEMREFRLPDGRAITAEVVGFDRQFGKVEIKLENGRRKKVSPAIFVEADQAYVKEWVSLEGFRNPGMFKVECEKRLLKKWKEESSAVTLKHKLYAYGITFENRGKVPLEDLKVDYRIFYEQEVNNSTTKKVDLLKKIQFGKSAIDILPPGGKREFTSKSVELERFEFNTGDYYVPDGDPESTTGRIRGIWVRVRVVGKAGNVAIRDFFEPASLEGKYDWLATEPQPKALQATPRRPLPKSTSIFQEAGWYYLGRNGVEKNLPKALELYEKAAEEGEIRAYRQIGFIYQRGGEEVSRDLAKAVSYFEKGYKAGDKKCAGFLGNLYLGRFGMPRDEEKALKWLLIGAEGNDSFSLFELVKYYGPNSEPERRDLKKAVEFANCLVERKSCPPAFLDAAAAVYAHTGDFKRAVKFQKEAVDTSNRMNKSLLEEMHRRLELYKQGKTE